MLNNHKRNTKQVWLHTKWVQWHSNRQKTRKHRTHKMSTGTREKYTTATTKMKKQNVIQSCKRSKSTKKRHKTTKCRQKMSSLSPQYHYRDEYNTKNTQYKYNQLQNTMLNTDTNRWNKNRLQVWGPFTCLCPGPCFLTVSPWVCNKLQSTAGKLKTTEQAINCATGQ